MDEDTVHLSDSEEARAAITRLLKAIEGWASRKSEKRDGINRFRGSTCIRNYFLS